MEVRRLVYNLFTGFTGPTCKEGYYNPFPKYHGHPSTVDGSEIRLTHQGG